MQLSSGRKLRIERPWLCSVEVRTTTSTSNAKVVKQMVTHPEIASRAGQHPCQPHAMHNKCWQREQIVRGTPTRASECRSSLRRCYQVQLHQCKALHEYAAGRHQSISEGTKANITSASMAMLRTPLQQKKSNELRLLRALLRGASGA